jgi:hypothetical protein
MRTERTQNSHWSEVPHELISCKYLTRTIFRNVILKLAFNQWRIKPWLCLSLRRSIKLNVSLTIYWSNRVCITATEIFETFVCVFKR